MRSVLKAAIIPTKMPIAINMTPAITFNLISHYVISYYSKKISIINCYNLFNDVESRSLNSSGFEGVKTER